ncbi:MAG: hypothetical protein FGM37_09300 [Phycisphaerales bacterium]|nr:hypothetical protein [Phycisphaerales bacterium]
MDALSGLTKQQLCDAIADTVGVTRNVLGPGSKEHVRFLRDVAHKLGLDSRGRKHELAQRIVKKVGQPWDDECHSAGETVTALALSRILVGLGRSKEYVDAGYKAAVEQLITQGPPSELPVGSASPTRLPVKRYSFYRDPHVAACVLAYARGRCEACLREAIFNRPNGTPYLEVHHVTPLANGGPDTVENTVALCPNCHRRAHHSIDAVLFSKQLATVVSTRTWP